MEKNEGAIVVSDAGPIIHLHELECLDLLHGFSAVLIPHEVWTEILRHRPALTLSMISKAQVCTAPTDASPSLATLADALSLDIGERAALRLMEKQSDALFLTDDAAARLAAESLTLKVHGTLGILIRALRMQLRSREQVLEVLNLLPQKSTLHISSDLLGEVIARVAAS